ncbi:MAG: quinolinate synthase NadA [Bacteroidetes bacterium]|nr:quinolinate synthase NadA [Bacteroidota bacterium]
MNFTSEIAQLKKKKNAVILAHYYQVGEIQEVADFIGDSLGLSQEAAKTNADIIVFAGVVFMAETAKIINPSKKVVVPEKEAGCSLVDSCPPDKFKSFIMEHPGYTVISYINCSAEVKAMSDIICTSTNSVKIVESLPREEKIIFAPDINLGRYVVRKTGREMVLWNGECEVHVNISHDKLLLLREKHPAAKLIAHPECKESVLKYADFIGSTTALINYVKTHPDPEFIVATEAGILHKMRQSVTGKNLIPAPAFEDNACACSECPYMKMNTMEKLYNCLVNEQPEIEVEEKTRLLAEKSIRRMLELSAGL